MSHPTYPGTPEPTGGYPPPPAYYVPGPPAQPAHGLATAAAWVAGLFALFEILEAALAWHAQSRYLDAIDHGEGLPWTPYDFTAFAWVGIMIATYVVTCLWLYRVRTNIDVLSPTLLHTRSRGWAWGGWVVPIVSLWFPYQVVRDVARDERGRSVVSGLGAWWTFWLLSLFVERIGIRVITNRSAVDSHALGGLGFVETTNAVLCLFALFFWIRIIRRITETQDRLLGINR
jgi:hypothetical protein